MTPSGIEPATFRFVAQYLNHCATLVPIGSKYYVQLLISFTPIIVYDTHFVTPINFIPSSVCISSQTKID
jgi:hypothetical protein